MNINLVAQDFLFPSIQGEGLYAGEPSIFLRLSGCNARCQWLMPDKTISICDTPYSSHFHEQNILDCDLIIKQIKYMLADYPNIKSFVITGGEPILQANALIYIIEKLFNYFNRITIETNGSIFNETLSGLDITFSISPKIFSFQATGSSLPEINKYKDTLNKYVVFTDSRYFKFVVNNDEDEFIQLLDLISTLKIETKNVVLMPCGRTNEELQMNAMFVWYKCIEHGFIYSDRLHVRVFNDKRGI